MSTLSVASDGGNSLLPQLDKVNQRVATNEEPTVLGAMMADQDMCLEVPKVISREDFYRPQHKVIWDAITTLTEQGRPGDPISVEAELEKQGCREQVGGGVYLFSLYESVPTSFLATAYAQEIKHASLRRRAAEQLQRALHIVDSASDPAELEQGIAASYEAALAAADGPQAATAQPVADDDDLFNDLVANLGKRPEGAFSTGIADLDKVAVAQHGALIMVSANTGVGKSFLAAQIARHYARDRQERVLFHSLEMSRAEMVERDLAAVSEVDLSAIMGVHDLAPTDHDLIVQEYMPTYRAWAQRLHYVEGRCGVPEVRRNAQRIQHEHRHDGGLGLVVVDYVQIMQRPGDVSVERDDLAIGAMTSALKDLARELGCIVLAISQFSNEGAKTSKPDTVHMKGSSSLGQDADVVAYLVDPSKTSDERDGEIDVLLPKVRKGVSGVELTLADYRHKGYFAALGTTTRAAMSADERAAAPPPDMSSTPI